MRRLARIGLAVIGLAAASPIAAWAEPPTSTPGAHKHRRTLLGREKLCVDCQRAKLRAQGIEIPAPPPLPQGVVMEGGSCPTCVSGPAIAANGHAVVGDAAPGYAVVGEPSAYGDPAPLGVVHANGGALAGRFAPSDRSVMPTSIAPPEPFDNGGHNRPHVVGHLFGVTAIGRDRREAREKRRGQQHASIRYDDPEPQKVTELPASIVYNRRWWQR